MSSFNHSSLSCVYVPTPSPSAALAFGTGDEFIWNLASETAALLAELDIFFAKDPDRNEGDGVLSRACLLTAGVQGVDGVLFFVFFWCGVEVLPLLRLRDGCWSYVWWDKGNVSTWEICEIKRLHVDPQYPSSVLVSWQHQL